MIYGWDDPPGPRSWSPGKRLALWLAAIALAVAALIHFDVDLGPSTADRWFQMVTGRPSPTRPPRP